MAQLFSSSLFFLIALLCGAASVASPAEAASTDPMATADWKQGIVVLDTKEVLSGEVHYDSRHDLVLLRSDTDRRVSVYTVHQVQSFRYYDPQENIIHRFLAVDDSRTSYSVRNFYEVVSEGDVLYLRRRNRCALDPPPGSSVHTVAYNYFAYYRGLLVRSQQFERVLLPVLAEAHPSLLPHIKEHRLKPYQVGDQIVLINYFNSRSPVSVANVSLSR